MKNFAPIWKMTVIEIKLYLREPMATFFTLGFPLMMLFLFGAIYGNDPNQGFGGRGTVDISVPAYMAMIIGTVGLLSIAIQVTSYREKGILRRFRSTPMRPHVILLDQVFVNFIMTLTGTAILIIAAKLAFNLRFDGNAGLFLAAFTLSSLSFFSLGFMIASVAPTMRVAQVAGMVIFYPMLFLSGATIPLEVMPESIRSVSKYLPLTYVVELLKGMWFGEPVSSHLTAIFILIGILVIGVLVSALTFRWE